MTGSAYGEIAKLGASAAAALSTTGWGRVVLVVIGGYVCAMGTSAWWNGSQHAWIAVVLGLALLGLAIFGWWYARRQDAKESQSRSVGGLVGLVVTLIAGGLLLLRRRKHPSVPAVVAAEAAPSAESDQAIETVEAVTALSPVEAGRRGMRGLIAALPGIAWGTVRGLFGGWLIFGALGLGLGLLTMASARWLLELPTWIVWTNFALAPLVLAVAGAYVGTIRGFLAALAQALVDRGVIPALYALVRPAIARVASSVAQRAEPLTRQEAVRRVHAHVEELSRPGDASAPTGALDRFERRIAARTQTWLAVASIATAADAPDRAAALADLEQRGVEGIESSLASTIVAAYRTHALVAFAIGLGILSIPWLAFAIVG